MTKPLRRNQLSSRTDNSKCAACGKLFSCGAVDKSKVCWCFFKKKVSIDNGIATCLCESCFDLREENSVKAHTFRLLISYIGDHFSGFQIQENCRTVEGELKRAIHVVTNESPQVIAAGRTDAGVHANGQVVSINLRTKLSCRQLTLALSAKLPKDISVWRVDRLPFGFDARRQSVGKRYVYQISQGLVQDPLLGNRAIHVRKNLDVSAMDDASKFFVGEHDFTSFRASACSSISAKRYIWHASAKRNGRIILIDIRGNAFCLNMVRIIVGTLLEVGRKKIAPKEIKNILLARDRKVAGMTAKPCGLSLYQVYYPDDLLDANIPEGSRFPRFPVTCDSWPFDNGDIEYGPF